MKRLVALCLLSACALTSKSAPRELRYFAPELAAKPAFTGAPCARVRLGRFSADAGLRLAIERRNSPVELVPSDTLRWADPPEIYARRAIANALFARPIEQAVTGPALVFDVEVTGFEQVGQAGVVALHFELRDDRRAVARGDIRAVRPASNATIEAFVQSIGGALATASDELADRVVSAACPR
ncbi:MAG TPA: ABC-type transport auxiliary lipoprotein family protein [Kofleriaceae bacterium]|nr:ABC-type transport auxiliary lipoprotein family protein [Kofleriaceae bacterium]